MAPLNASSLRPGLAPTPAVPAISAAGANAGTPTAPDRLPARPTPARPFADMLRQHRGDAAAPAPPPDGVASSSANEADDAGGAPTDTVSDRPGVPAKTKARTGTPARSPAAADKGIRDGRGLAETRALDERPDEAGPERPLPATEVAATLRPTPVVEDKAARTAGAAAEPSIDADASSASAIDIADDSETAAPRTGRQPAADTHAGRRGDAARPPSTAITPAAEQSAPVPAGTGRLADAGALRPSFDSALHAASAASAAAAPVASVESKPSDPAAPALTLPTPVDSPEFAGALGVQVSLFARDGVQQAELHLNPAEMGPVSIRIELDGSDAQVQFGADLAETRQAIESGLPELASALRDAGFTLCGGGVSQHAGQRPRDDGTPAAAAALQAGDAADPNADPARVSRRIAAGGVDLYA